LVSATDSDPAGPVLLEQRDGDVIAVRFKAMAGPCEVLLPAAVGVIARELGEIAAREAWRIEKKYSRYRQDSVLAWIHSQQGAAVRVDAETASLIDFAQQCFQISDGLFDITSGILRRAWKFDGSDRLPDAAAVQGLLPLIGFDKLRWQSPFLTLPAGMELDLGGIGKEYAVDRACTLVSAQSRHPLLVNCGGDLAASAPRRDGQPWLVGIDAQIADLPTPVIRLLRGAVATSGDAHRFLLKDGVRYPHILNPKTGWPVLGGPRVVTVAADTCTEAGVLSTLALLHGAQAAQLLQKFGADSQLIW